MLVGSRSAAKPRAYVQPILLEDGNHTTMIMEKKKDCRLTSIVIGEVLLVPGEEGAPPGTRHSRFGDAIRNFGGQIMEQFCLPRSRIFVDHFPRSLFVLV